MKSFIGKRVIIFWTTEAFNRGSDWPSFLIIDADEDTAWCQGVNSPDGTPHDGSKCAIMEKDTLNIIEWTQ